MHTLTQLLAPTSSVLCCSAQLKDVVSSQLAPAVSRNLLRVDMPAERDEQVLVFMSNVLASAMEAQQRSGGLESVFR